jgi:PAS domain S-box-containing protein
MKKFNKKLGCNLKNTEQHPYITNILKDFSENKTTISISEFQKLAEDLNNEFIKIQDENIALKIELQKTNKDIIFDSQNKLQIQKERFVHIINSMNDALCVIDDFGNITFANPVAEKIIGKEILIGENIYKYIKINEGFNKQSLIKNTSISKSTKSQFVQMTSDNGKEIPLKCSWSELKNERNITIGKVLVFNDFSIEHETNMRLQQAKDRAVEMSKLKSEFLATMSHEIRTPLNGIISLISLLELSELDEEQKEDVKDLGASANLLLSIISNILDLSKIESGKMYLDYQKFSIRHLTNDVSRIFNAQFQEKEIFFLTEIIGEIPNYILADYTRLKQVLVNLISNSLKFTGQKGCIVLLIKSKLNFDNNYILEFSIIDTGVGISQNKISSLFSAFVQADGSITRNFGGSGLGLSICKNLVDLMGGSIKVKSREGVGTVFSFNFSVEEAVVSENSLAKLKSVETNNIEEKSRESVILVVDDNPINLSTTTRYLEKFGIKTFSAKSGDEALEISSTKNLDLILLDLHLPTMSGYEVTRFIRDSNLPVSKVPILAITADVLEGTEQACLDAGFSGFFPKPLNLLELVKSIDLIIGKDKQRNSHIN